MALLEVLVALVVVTIAGVATVGRFGAAIRHGRLLATEERRMERAGRTMAALSLLTRAEFDQRIGSQRVGDFVAVVQRPDQELYRVTISAPETVNHALLVTVLYRPRRNLP